MGCSLLVCLADRGAGSGGYKAGDVVEARPFGAVFGTEERPPHFGRVDLDGTFALEKVRKYQAQQHDTADGLQADVPGGAPFVARRLWRVDLSLLSAATLNLLRTTRVLVKATGGDATWPVARSAFVNKKTGLSETASEAALS